MTAPPEKVKWNRISETVTCPCGKVLALRFSSVEAHWKVSAKHGGEPLMLICWCKRQLAVDVGDVQ